MWKWKMSNFQLKQNIQALNQSNRNLFIHIKNVSDQSNRPAAQILVPTVQAARQILLTQLD